MPPKTEHPFVPWHPGFNFPTSWKRHNNSNCSDDLLKQGVLRVAVAEWPPWLKAERDFLTDDILKISGVLAETWKVLATSLKLKYRIVDPKLNYCNRTTDDCIRGMLRMIADGTAEVALGPFPAGASDVQESDFSSAVYVDHLKILFGRKVDHRDLFTYFNTLDWQVWLTLLLSTFIVAIFSTGILRILEEHAPKKRAVSITYCDQLWRFFASICDQGEFRDVGLLSWRTLTSAWWLAVLVILCCLNGSVITSLTNDKQRVTFNDLISDPKIQLLAPRQAVIRKYFESSKDPRLKKLWQRRSKGASSEADYMDGSISQLLDKVDGGKHALVAWSSDVNHALSRRINLTNNCQYWQSRDRYFPNAFVMAYSKKKMNACTKRIIDKRLQTIVQSHLIEHFLDIETRGYENCFNEPHYRERSLTLNDMQGILLFWLIGAGVSLLVLVTEVAWNQFINRKKPLPTIIPILRSEHSKRLTAIPIHKLTDPPLPYVGGLGPLRVKQAALQKLSNRFGHHRPRGKLPQFN